MRSASRSGSRRNTVADNPPDAQKETILAEAERIASADRQRYYGHPLDNHRCTAEMWQAYLLRCGWTPPARGMNVRDVCQLNILQKISRDANQPKRDNLVDTCGYARNAEQADEELLRRIPGAFPAIKIHFPGIDSVGSHPAQPLPPMEPWIGDDPNDARFLDTAAGTVDEHDAGRYDDASHF